MRVTQFSFYNNFVINQQKSLNELTKTQTEIASGTKINNIYDTPSIYTKFLKLDIEENSIKQVKSSATFAKTFADNSDAVLNDFVSTLDSFKVKLLNAANDTNNNNSREAIVKELEGQLNHLKDLANTSIDGKYLFSGTKFNVKPIDDDFKYQGNDGKVKAFLGAKVEREYNIDGKELFLGRDSDYKKHISLNIPQYNKLKEHREFVVRGNDGKLYIDKDNPKADSTEPNIKEPVTLKSEIRALTGVEDIDNGDGSYSDGTSYFYLKGKTPSGETIDTKFSLMNSSKVSDLLDKIGEKFGNTSVNKVVDVSLNDQGEIEIRDRSSNKLITDFFLVASDQDRNSVEDLAKNGDYIVEFQKSSLYSTPNADTIIANNKYFDNRIFKFSSELYNFKQQRAAIEQDKVFDVLGNKGILNDSTVNIDKINFVGKDTNGSDVNVSLKIDATTKMSDIVNKIKDNFGDVNVKIENGEIVIIDNTISKTETSKLSISLIAKDSNDNNIDYFNIKDSIVKDKLFFEKTNNQLIANHSNIERDIKTIIKDGEYISLKNQNAQNFVTLNSTIIDSSGSDQAPQEINLTFRDKNGDLKVAKISLDDNGSTFSINGNSYHIYSNKGDYSPAHDKITTTTSIDEKTCQVCTKEDLTKGVTYSQLGDVVSMLVSNNLPSSDSFEAYQDAVNKAKQEVDAGVDGKGRFYLKDLSNNKTNIDISLYSDNLSFQSNSAITIDSAQVDFFESLQEAIEAVKKGDNYPNSNRSIGIQGAIERIDHITDHIRRSHSTIGAISKEFELSIERSDTLMVHIQTLQSENIDTDIGEATMRLNSLKLSYQGLLSSIAKINNLTLLNYLK